MLPAVSHLIFQTLKDEVADRRKLKVLTQKMSGQECLQRGFGLILFRVDGHKNELGDTSAAVQLEFPVFLKNPLALRVTFPAFQNI